MNSDKISIRSDRLAFSVTAALETGVFPTRTKLYAAIARGDIETWKDGRSRMISADSLREYIRRKTSEGRATEPGEHSTSTALHEMRRSPLWKQPHADRKKKRAS